jgi:hypothetical protein
MVARDQQSFVHLVDEPASNGPGVTFSVRDSREMTALFLFLGVGPVAVTSIFVSRVKLAIRGRSIFQRSPLLP